MGREYFWRRMTMGNIADELSDQPYPGPEAAGTVDGMAPHDILDGLTGPPCEPDCIDCALRLRLAQLRDEIRQASVPWATQQYLESSLRAVVNAAMKLVNESKRRTDALAWVLKAVDHIAKCPPPESGITQDLLQTWATSVDIQVVAILEGHGNRSVMDMTAKELSDLLGTDVVIFDLNKPHD